MDAARVHAWIGAVVAATGPWAPLLLFGAALVEYVFPPFPGDLVVVFGAWYAVHGELSWPVTFVAVTLGAVAGAALDHRLGMLLGRGLEGPWAHRLGISTEKVARFEAAYRRWGVWLLLANRFMPGIRGFLFLAAGAARIPLRTVVLYGGISAAIWNAGLLAAGAFLAKNADELVELFRRYTETATAVLAAVALAAVAAWLWRRRRARQVAGRP
ncbi:MAG: DedA family protein [Anaeromyxobacteraceae bacterium]